MTPPCTDSAISPGRTTRKGKSILGNAAISGVRRAAVIESAAMARCTTRKSVPVAERHHEPQCHYKPQQFYAARGCRHVCHFLSGARVCALGEGVRHRRGVVLGPESA